MRSVRSSRGKARRPLKPRVIVVTEGANTEPQYITEFLRLHRAANVRVVGTGFDPRGVVEKAIAEKKEADATSKGTSRARVWAVFDRDEHLRFEEAQQLAEDNGICVAASNPCFELWAVFHYRDHAAPISTQACQRLLAGLCDGYRADRGKFFRDEAAIRNNHDTAVRRGERSLREREGEGAPQGNPSTSMHVLMESIRTQDRSPATGGGR